MSRFIDLTGERFGRLIIIRKVDNDKWGKPYWLCLCSCGKNKVVKGSSLRDGRTKSCGCLRKDMMTQRSTKHNHAVKGKESRTYYSWDSMVQRCTNSNNIGYNHYGGRGIAVCKRWSNSFKNFLEDMGECAKGHSLDRINNNLGYYKVNCRWATPKQQAQNRRSNRKITYDGKTQCLSAWAEEFNMTYSTLYSRLHYGWKIKEALITPIYAKRIK